MRESSRPVAPARDTDTLADAEDFSSFTYTPPGWWRRMHEVETLTVARRARRHKDNTRRRKR
jgi:hypothetical protein